GRHRTAACGIRSRRLAGADPNHFRNRRRRNLGDARARGRACPLSRDARTQGAGAGARRPRRGERIAMHAFARLLDCLVYTQSRNRKVALLGRYFRATPDPDRGWALAALTDGVPVRLPLRRMLMDLVSRFIDPVLYRLSRDYVGDTAETVALLWPDDSSTSASLRARESWGGDRRGESVTLSLDLSPALTPSPQGGG